MDWGEVNRKVNKSFLCQSTFTSTGYSVIFIKRYWKVGWKPPTFLVMILAYPRIWVGASLCEMSKCAMFVFSAKNNRHVTYMLVKAHRMINFGWIGGLSSIVMHIHNSWHVDFYFPENVTSVSNVFSSISNLIIVTC